MHFDPPLQQGRLLRRYKRFMADILTAEGEPLTLHCPNTGSMKHCTPEGAAVLYSDSGNPKRKYRHTLEAVQVAHGHWAGVNTSRTNALVAEAVLAGQVPELRPEGLRREVRFADSRFDLALGGATPHTFVEVKNVTLGPGPDDPDHGLITFPDAVTLRGQKHLRTLMEVVTTGRRAVLLFCVQHTGAREVAPADEIDPAYGRLLREAASVGVEILAWRTDISPQAFRLAAPVPVLL
ncbi:DNA/RNA nuclease SfsA [Isoalcanivorax indicus]|uniref:DNA/RNA nuclease SfsA n=1 Tax=Isoalcanivorax indicus TaxID=2202653 RepID=UPI000DB9F639|nr:DNA/RNA nuclease SfsA [Isoalcanivorax indicus]